MGPRLGPLFYGNFQMDFRVHFEKESSQRDIAFDDKLEDQNVAQLKDGRDCHLDNRET